MKKIIKKLLKPYAAPLNYRLSVIENYIEQSRILTAKLLIKDIHNTQRYPRKLSDIGFKVFSQWDEDGIIQFLIAKVPIENNIFIEFGIEDYRESNTRFLLMNNNWRGLIMDSDPANIKKIQSSEIYWRHDLSAVQAFVTRQNINRLIQTQGMNGDIGILSIDIDGNDYWIWEAIDIVSPRIVICEYNSIFGSKEAVTIPYDENFNRLEAHFSCLYFGASLRALCILAERKGYIFVGSSIDGSNAFFARHDVAKKLKPLNYKDGYVLSKARQSKDKTGHLTYIRGGERIKLIAHLPVIDLLNNKRKLISDLTF